MYIFELAFKLDCGVYWVTPLLRRWLLVVSNCDMCILSVKMWSSLAYGLVEQGSEALGPVGSHI